MKMFSEPEEDDEGTPFCDEVESGIESSRSRRRRTRYIILLQFFFVFISKLFSCSVSLKILLHQFLFSFHGHLLSPRRFVSLHLDKSNRKTVTYRQVMKVYRVLIKVIVNVDVNDIHAGK